MQLVQIPKAVLYIILLTVLGASVAFYLNTSSSLSENLFATALGMVIAVFVIDTLTQADKSKRYKQLNRQVVRNIRLTVALCLITSRSDLGDETDHKTEALKKSTSELLVIFNNELNQLIENATDEQINQLGSNISDAAKSIDRALSKIAPHPSIKAKQLISEIDITTGVLAELTKVYAEINEITGSAASSDQEQPIFGGLDHIWRGQYLELINRLGGNLIELHKLASDNKLQEIV